MTYIKPPMIRIEKDGNLLDIEIADFTKCPNGKALVHLVLSPRRRASIILTDPEQVKGVEKEIKEYQKLKIQKDIIGTSGVRVND